MKGREVLLAVEMLGACSIERLPEPPVFKTRLDARAGVVHLQTLYKDLRSKEKFAMDILFTGLLTAD